MNAPSESGTPGKTHCRFRTSFGQHGTHIVQSQSQLCNKIIGLELLLRVPADQAGGKYETALRGDARRIA